MSHSLASPEELASLAPPRLPNHRVVRYDGDGVFVHFEELADADREIVQTLYDSLSRLADALSDELEGARVAVQRWCTKEQPHVLAQRASRLGVASVAQNRGHVPRLEDVMHDVRGGALSALLTRLQQLERRPSKSPEVSTLRVLVRDHAKAMRSAVVGLDDAARLADQQTRPHTLAPITARWCEVVGTRKVRGRSARLRLESSFEGVIAECCLERVALDRVFYTLTDHACLRAVGGQLECSIFRPAEDDAHLRFVLVHQVSDLELRRLRRRVGVDEHRRDAADVVDLSVLFDPEQPDPDADGSLVEVADFTRAAFGLDDWRTAVAERYVGACARASVVSYWFHWPIGPTNVS